MRRLHIYSMLLIAVIGLTALSAFGQDGPPPDGMKPEGRPMGPPPPDGQRPPDRGAMLRELGLSKEQFQQIRRMNQERKPIMEAARERLENANRSLDEAIYADAVNEHEIEARMKEAQAAQSEMVKLRAANELQVRKVLTPEQLVKFRELREKFERMRENMKDRIDDRRPNMPPMNNPQQLRPGNDRPPRRPV